MYYWCAAIYTQKWTKLTSACWTLWSLCPQWKLGLKNVFIGEYHILLGLKPIPKNKNYHSISFDPFHHNLKSLTQQFQCYCWFLRERLVDYYLFTDETSLQMSEWLLLAASYRYSRIPGKMNLVEVHTTTVTRLYKSHPITNPFLETAPQLGMEPLWNNPSNFQLTEIPQYDSTSTASKSVE